MKKTVEGRRQYRRSQIPAIIELDGIVAKVQYALDGTSPVYYVHEPTFGNSFLKLGFVSELSPV